MCLCFYIVAVSVSDLSSPSQWFLDWMNMHEMKGQKEVLKVYYEFWLHRYGGVCESLRGTSHLFFYYTTVH